MPTLAGFGTFAALPEERISDKISRRILSGDQGMIVWWSIGAGVHVEPHSHASEQIVWMLKGKMEFRLGSEQRVCGSGDVVVIPGGTEHEGWFPEDTEVIDFFSARRLPRRRQTRLHERRLTTPSFRTLSSYATATLAAAKGRLTCCTVPGSTPNCLAMTRTPGRPGAARASRIRFSFLINYKQASLNWK
jgi:quercetin dioxygenase-like cupin family protein